MGLTEPIRGIEKTNIASLLGLDTILFMGMVRRAVSGRYVLIMPSTDEFKEETD